LSKIFGAGGGDGGEGGRGGGYKMQEALSSLYSLDKTPEESIQWIYKNFSSEFGAKGEESFLHGLHYLGRADTFLGRARSRENFKFWRYASSLMACSVISAGEVQREERGERRERVGRREGGWQRRYFRSPWQRERGEGGEGGRKSEPRREEVAKKIADYCKVPLSYARLFVVPFLKFFFEDEGKAVETTALLQLDARQVAFLVEREERAKRIYEAAAVARAVKKEKEGVKEAVVKEEEEREEEEEEEREEEVVEVVEVVEEEGEEAVEKGEAKTEVGEVKKDQKTLADFWGS